MSDTLTKDQLLTSLSSLSEDDDWEVAHVKADNLLLAYIGDSEIKEAYSRVGKWYA